MKFLILIFGLYGDPAHTEIPENNVTTTRLYPVPNSTEKGRDQNFTTVGSTHPGYCVFSIFASQKSVK